jgi:sigma-B regulation protein RsbU (phosphoserine phosphatase)
MATKDTIRSLQAEVTRLRNESQDLEEELSLLRSSVRALRVLQDLNSNLTAGIDILKWIDELLASALAAIAAEDGSLILVDEETGELVFAVVHGRARDRLTGYRMPPGEGIAGWVVQNRVPEIVSDPRKDPRFNPEIDDMLGFRTRSIASVPLIAGERVLGVIEALNKVSDREFTVQDEDLMMLVANLASGGLSMAEAFMDKP